MNRGRLITLGASLAALLAAILWGVNYIFQQQGAYLVDPFLFSTTRMLLGAAVLIPTVYIRNYNKSGKIRFWNVGDNKKETYKAGAVLGVLMVAMIVFQQIGVAQTTVGKAGFIVSLNVVLVPILSMFLGKKVKLYQWISIAGAMVGVSLLTLSGIEGPSVGDLLMFGAAISVAISIMVTGSIGTKVDTYQLMSVRFVIGGTITLLLSLVTKENISVKVLKNAMVPILFAGVIGTGITFTLQGLALRVLDDVTTAVIMSLESVFAALSGWIVLGDVLSPKEILGCVLVFASTVGMQVYSEIRLARGLEKRDLT